MKRRYVFVLMMAISLSLLTGITAFAEPAAPPSTEHGPTIRIGLAWGVIVQDRAAAHNFVRPAPEEPPAFTVMPGTTVRLVARASGLWLGQPGGTLSASLEVYAVDNEGGMTLLADDEVSDTREGPAFEHRPLAVRISFDQPGRIHLLVRFTASAEPQEGEPVQDVDELEAFVTVLDPATFGAVSGQVTASDTGEGLEGLPVTAGNRELRIHRTAHTDADGNYAIEGLPPGEYIVGVRAKGTAYVGKFYKDAHSPAEATPVTVTEGSETADIFLELDRGAEISGQVIDATTEEPLAGIPIMVRPVRPADDATAVTPAPPAPATELQRPRPLRPQARPEPHGQTGPSGRRHRRPRPAAVTGDDGTYVIQGWPAGEYTVAAGGLRQGYGVEFWEEVPTPEDATPIAVQLGESVTNIDFTLEPQSR